MAQHLDPRGSKRIMPERPPAANWARDARAVRREQELAERLHGHGIAIVAFKENRVEVCDAATGRSAAVARMPYESHVRTGRPPAAAVVRLARKHLDPER